MRSLRAAIWAVTWTCGEDVSGGLRRDVGEVWALADGEMYNSSVFLPFVSLDGWRRFLLVGGSER